MVNIEHTAVLIFPHQLFLEHPALNSKLKVYIVEDQIFFSDPEFNINFHKKKILLHRASMKYYAQALQERGFQVEYVDYEKDPEMGYIFNQLQEEGVNKIILAEIIDYSLKRRLIKQCKLRNMGMVELDGPGFLTPQEKIITDLSPSKGGSDRKSRRYLMNSFYIKQRKALNILLKNGRPVGGKWSYDKSNRKKIPRGTPIPPILELGHSDKTFREAVEYVETNFPHHTGDTRNFNYPLTHKQAEKCLQDFTENRLPYFGDYEDAILKEEPFLFHSIISPALNIGLLTPRKVIDEIDRAEVPLNSKEGYIRQIIGWREFMRGIYYRESLKERTKNFMNHQEKINRKLYWGNTGLAPYDKIVKRVQKHAYAHHIERLMIIGNLMFLLEINPDEVYRWFMEMFIDSYDWVMVPNVYGMSQYADGGLITTKPYFSSSHYIKKMSDFKRGKWTAIWDALFWVFMEKNQKIMSKNPRTALLLGNLRNKEKMEKHHKIAEKYIQSLKE